MALQSEAGIRLGLEINQKVAGERSQGFLLAGEQSGVGILKTWLRGRKIYAVKRKPLLDCSHDGDVWLRRRWRLQVHHGRGRSQERVTAVVAHVTGYGDGTGLRVRSIQGRGGIAARDVSSAGRVAVRQNATIRAGGNRCDSCGSTDHYASRVR